MILGQDLGQIAQSPAHYAVGGRRSLFDEGLEDIALIRAQAGTGTRGLTVDQPIRTGRVEGHHPVTPCLQTDPADLGRFRARAAR